MVDCRLRHQSGNIFFALFGTIALIGILGAGVMSFIKGPLTVSVNLTKTSVAENQMTIAAQAAVMASANGVAGGDCDSDNVIEPVEWRTYTTEPHPVGGGLVPQTLGVKTKDPWGTEYGYCVWNHGVTTTGAGCGANLLAGTNSQTYPVVALVSAGPDRAFTTTCRTYAAADVNSDGDIVDATDLELISEATPNDDDIIYKYSYEDAIGAAGGLWGLKSTDPDTASIGKGIEVTGNASSTGTGTFSGGMLLPDSSLITCDPSTSGVMARSSSGTGIELCDGSSWQAISGSGGSSCPSGYTLNGDRCYKLTVAGYSNIAYDDARTACQADGGDLATINDSTEFTYINTIRGTALAYVGYSDSASEGTWVWIDGTSSYINWAPGEPNGGVGESCGLMTDWAGGTLADVPCAANGFTTSYICEVAAVSSSSGVSLPDQTVNTICDPASIGLMRYNTAGTSSSTTVATVTGGGGGSYATPAIVQTTTPTECTGSCGTSTRTFSTTPTAGNMIIALVTGVGNGTVCDIGANTTLSDNKGNTYTKAVATNETNVWRANTGIWYAPVDSTSASFIVTAQNTAGGCSTWFTLQTMEVSGLATTSALDVTSSAISGASNVTTVTTAATSQASEFAVGAYDSTGGYGASVSISPGWTMVTGSGTGEVYHVYNILSSTGAVSNTWTASDTYSAGAIATFKASSSGGGGGSITYVGSNTDGIGGFATASRTLTVNAPAGFAAGDLLIYAISSDSNAAETYTWPAGFTQIYSPSTFVADGQEWAIAYKIASGSETTLSVTAPDTWGVVGTVVAYRGVDATTPITAQSSQMDASSTSSPWTLTGTSITPTAANSKILFFASADTDWTASGGTTGGTLSYTPPAGYTERVDYQGASGDQKTFGSLIIADKDQATATATGAVTGTLTSSAGGTAVTGSILLALNPSGSATSSSETITSSSYAQVCDGSGWVNIGRNELNDLTDVITNYTGTASVSTASLYSMYLGDGAGKSTVTGAQYNTSLGYQSLYSLASGTDNTAMGYQAMKSTTTGSNNAAFGSKALYTNIVGSYNAAMGYGALYANTGSYNTGFGYGALYSGGAKYANTAIGYEAMYYGDDASIASAANNTAIGYRALKGGATASANTGTDNTALGYGALTANTAGIGNTAAGYESLRTNATGGNYNTGIGYQSLYSHTSNSHGAVGIGYQAGYSNTQGNTVAIGAGAYYSGASAIGNVAAGYNAMYYANSSAATPTTNNTAVGAYAMRGTTTASANTGTDNTAIGHSSLYGIRNGSYNTAAGALSLYTMSRGSSNTAAGAYALYSANRSSYNTALGFEALRYTYSGTSTASSEGYANTSVGYQALRMASASAATNTGNYNTALGAGAMLSATTASEAVAVGAGALSGNTTAGAGAGTGPIAIGYGAVGNTGVTFRSGLAIGYNSQFASVTSGHVAIGNLTMLTTTGSTVPTRGGVAIGDSALKVTSSGYSVGVGYMALQNNSTGGYNTAIGYRAGMAGTPITTGANNTFIGYNAQSNNNAYSNGAAIGNGAVLTASNRIVLGNTSIAGIYAQVTSITAISDRRHKKDIIDTDLGLSFINTLHPVSYRFNNGDETLRYGLIAQDVEKSLPDKTQKLVGKKENGLALVNHDDDKDQTYHMNYGELFAPLVKAIQELDKKIDAVIAKFDVLVADTKIQIATFLGDAKELQQKRADQDKEIAELEKSLRGLQLSCVAAKGTKDD